MLKLCLRLYVFCFCRNNLLDCERQFVVLGGWLGRCLSGWLDDKVAGLLAE